MVGEDCRGFVCMDLRRFSSAASRDPAACRASRGDRGHLLAPRVAAGVPVSATTKKPRVRLHMATPQRSPGNLEKHKGRPCGYHAQRATHSLIHEPNLHATIGAPPHSHVVVTAAITLAALTLAAFTLATLTLIDEGNVRATVRSPPNSWSSGGLAKPCLDAVAESRRHWTVGRTQRHAASDRAPA